MHAGCYTVNRISPPVDDLRQTAQQLYALLQAQTLEESLLIDQLGFQLSQRRSLSPPPDRLADACEASDDAARLGIDVAAAVLSGNPFMF